MLVTWRSNWVSTAVVLDDTILCEFITYFFYFLIGNLLSLVQRNIVGEIEQIHEKYGKS